MRHTDSVLVPTASLVIATHNGGTRVPRLFDAFEKQQDAPPFEVVVVDDASTDGTADIVHEAAAGRPFPVQVLRLDRNAGPAVARNRGWRSANGDLIVFTDDDCVPEPEWLGTLTDALAGADIAQGRTIPDPAHVREIGPFGHSVEVKAEDGFYETCNIAYRRSALECVEGFDERFRHPFGEDSDLAWRAKAAGFSSTFVADAVVVHDVSPSDFRSYLKRLRRRDGLVLAMQRHPQLRRTYQMGLFFSPTHPYAIALTAAIVSAAARPSSPRRWLSVGALAGAYARAAVKTRRGPMRRRQWVSAVPQSFAADIVEIGVFARASARHRTLFL